VLAIDSNYLDQSLVNICDSIIAHASADIQNRLQSGISAWDGEERIVSKGLEDLMQMDFQVRPSIAHILSY
jgi:hypothetical protein